MAVFVETNSEGGGGQPYGGRIPAFEYGTGFSRIFLLQFDITHSETSKNKNFGKQ